MFLNQNETLISYDEETKENLDVSHDEQFIGRSKVTEIKAKVRF